MDSDSYHYRAKHLEIVRQFESCSPLVEGGLPGSCFIDISGTGRLFGPGPDLACRMERDLWEKIGLRARIGLASNKLVSQVAARCTDPGHLRFIFAGGEEPFLSPLPVDYLPGIGETTASKLAGFNILRIGQLASFPLDVLSAVFGRSAERLLRIAKGVDTSAVFVTKEVPRISVAKILKRDEIDPQRLESALFEQVEEAGWELRLHNRRPGVVRLEIRYADGVWEDTKRRLSPWDVVSDRSLFQSVLPALRRIFRRRVAVRRLIMEFSELAMSGRQLPLFTWENNRGSKERDLQEALDSMRKKFGKTIISWARPA
jgi:DNA polymerase-4